MGAGVLLTTLDNVKSVLDVKNDVADDKLLRLIRNASAVCLNICNRQTFAKTLYSETYDGYGKNWIVLRQPDPLDLVSLAALGRQYQPATGDGFTDHYRNGYVLDRNRVTLYGFAFPNARSSIIVNYHAGQIATETHAVPDAEPYALNTFGVWLADESVSYVGGAALVKVSATPAAGQYAVSSEGEYAFNAVDAGANVDVSFSCVPADVEEGVASLVAERFRWETRIGTNSKALAGQETVSFSANQLPTYFKELLISYKRVI